MFSEIGDFCVIPWLLLVLFCPVPLSVPGYTPCEPSQAMAETYYRAPVDSFAAVLHLFCWYYCLGMPQL